MPYSYFALAVTFAVKLLGYASLLAAYPVRGMWRRKVIAILLA